MFPLNLAASLIGKMSSLALLGIGVLFVGPIALGVVAVILPFVVIGAIAYLPYRLARRWLGNKRNAPLEAPKLRPLTLAVERPILAPAPAVPPIERKPKPAGAVARMLGEVACGALVGGVLGMLAGYQSPELMNYASLGVGIGTVVGFVVGGPRTNATEKAPVV